MVALGRRASYLVWPIWVINAIGLDSVLMFLHSRGLSEELANRAARDLMLNEILIPENLKSI
jgi:hypothetical protein